MAHFFSYLNSPEAQAPSAAPRITHQEEGREADDTALADKEFDETADADLGGNNTGEEGEWILPDPATITGEAQVQTPLDQLAAAAANTFNTPIQATGATIRDTPLIEGHDALRNIHRAGADFTPAHHTTRNEGSPIVEAPPTPSALISSCRDDNTIRTGADLIAFLEWQASRRGDGEEQKKFREDALAFPRLLVFACMRKKSIFVHLIHSAGVYPNIPGADPAWKGKIVGFLGDKITFAAPQMVELGKNVAWAWDDPLICKDTEAMAAFYAVPENKEKFWIPPGDAPKVRMVCPRMLALPPIA
jgi:hypothetical protein